VWSGTGGGGRQLLGTVEGGGTTRCGYSVSLPPGGRSAEWWWELLEDELSGTRFFVPVVNPTTEGRDGTCCKENEYIVPGHYNQCSQIIHNPQINLSFVLWDAFLDNGKFFKFSLWKKMSVTGDLFSGIYCNVVY
jgi:hypothetical protein